MRICQACDARFPGPEWLCPARHGAIHQLTSTTTDIGYAAEHFEQLAPVEALHFWFTARNELIVWALDRYFPDARTLLEVGCGSGYVLAGLNRSRPSLRLTASEAFLEGLLLAARRVPDAELLQADARRLPFEREFDVAGAFDVLEHIVEDGEAMRQMAQALRPGGGVIITVPQHAGLWSRFDTFAGHHAAIRGPR